MKSKILGLLAVWLLAGPMAVQALVIDTNPTWDGNINNGWYGSGQTITVDATESYFV